MTARFRRRLGRERRGATLVEFGLLAPVLIVLLMGLGELLYKSYVRAILDGEIQKAARDAGIEGGAVTSSILDTKVVTRMTPIMKKLNKQCGGAASTPTWCATRRSYDSFSRIGPEPFTDRDGDGIRDPGECFDDVNANGAWDADPGRVGQGGASAVTLYTVSLTFPNMFPVARLFGWPSRSTVSSTTVLKNQPYASQSTTAVTTVCT